MSRLTTRLLSLFSLILTAVVTISANSTAQSMATPARHALLMDVSTGDVLFEKAADDPFPPASMSKLMTVYLAFEAIRDGRHKLDEEVIVSDEAWRNWNNRGSTMFLRARDKVTIADLLRGIIVLSGNDACVVLAEHMAGTQEVFVEWLNARAIELGFENSSFLNSNGWPADGHVMSARDLAKLSYHLITEFPDLYPMFAEREYLYKEFHRNKYNRNPLLGMFPGADGLKTGHTEESGYGLTASAERDGRRLILVVSGLSSSQERMRESQRLMQYGFRNFKYYPLFRAGETVEHADVWLGDVATVPMVLGEDLGLTLSRRQRAQMKVTVDYMNPIPAPLKKGDRIAELVVTAPDRRETRLPLLAAKNIGEVGGFGKITAALEYLLFGAATDIASRVED